MPIHRRAALAGLTHVSPPRTSDGAVRTVAAVATVARPGTPPLPRPRMNAMKASVWSWPAGGREVATLT